MNGLRWRWRLTVTVGILSFVGSGFCSAEDELPRLNVTIQRVASQQKYDLGRATIGELAYIDRKYAFRKLPKSLLGQVVVRTSMDDDYAEAPDHLVL